MALKTGYQNRSISELHGTIRGKVITPGDAGYDAARQVFYGGIDYRPAVIVQAADEQDVQQTISFASQSGMELAVRSGGHSPAGHSVSDGGIVLDLRNMRGLEIDAQERTAWVQTGMTAGEYTTAAAEHGLATPFGDTASVGIGGITLSGGVGYLVRKYGLTIDSLLRAEVVTADGQLLRADADHHSELFWALRGGGGNFGVATRFQFRLHPVEHVAGGMLILPGNAETIAAFMDAAQSAPDELSAIANIMPAPPMPFVPVEHHGKLIIMALMVYAGEIEAGEQALARFRALAEPLADMLRPMHYPEIYLPEDESYHPTAVARTMFMDRVDRSVADTILRYLEASDASLRVAQLRALGGAMARVPSEATAFAHRASRIMVNVAAFYDGEADKPARQAWVDDFAAALSQDDQGVYVGFLGDEGPGRLRAAYPGTTWERLRAIKSRYDPGNLFRRNQNIVP